MVSAFNDTVFDQGDWEFTCVDWDTATLDLYKKADDPTRTCDMSLGAIDATSGRLLKGAQFSTPTYPGSLKILVLNPTAKVDRWAFLAPFNAQLWIALFGTSVAVACSVWLQEVTWRRIFTHPMPALKKLSNLQWASMALMVQILAEFSARRIGARLTILGYGFLVLIAINTYMAVLAARLTVNTIQSDLNSLDELASKPVGVFVDYVDDVKQHTSLLNIVSLPWDTLDDEISMLTKLRTGEVAALLMDAPWAEYQAAINCDLMVATQKQSIMPFNYGFGFPVDFPHDELANINLALAQLMEEGIFTALENQYIKPAAVCPSKSSQADLASVQLNFNQMSGLWIFLAATTALGWTVDLVQAVLKGWAQWKRTRLQGASPSRDDSVEVNDRDPSAHANRGFGRIVSGGADDVEVAKAYSKAGDALGGERVASMSGTSLRSLGSRLEGRSKSFFGRPEVADSWMAVADASTVEEMVELLGAQVRHMDARLRKSLPALERRLERSQQLILAALEDAAAAARSAAVYGGVGGADGGSAGGGLGGCSIVYDDEFSEGGRQLLQAVAAGRPANNTGSFRGAGCSHAGVGSHMDSISASGAAAGDDAATADPVVALQAPSAPSEARLIHRPTDGKNPFGSALVASHVSSRSVSNSGVESATLKAGIPATHTWGSPPAAALSRNDYLARRISRVQFQTSGPVSAAGIASNGSFNNSRSPLSQGAILHSSFNNQIPSPHSTDIHGSLDTRSLTTTNVIGRASPTNRSLNTTSAAATAAAAVAEDSMVLPGSFVRRALAAAAASDSVHSDAVPRISGPGTGTGTTISGSARDLRVTSPLGRLTNNGTGPVARLSGSGVGHPARLPGNGAGPPVRVTGSGISAPVRLTGTGMGTSKDERG